MRRDQQRRFPSGILGAVNPVINHNLRELRAGAPCEHVIREAALMAFLIGQGWPPAAAIRAVEAREQQLIGMWPGEAREGFHPGWGRPGGMTQPGYGQMGKMPYGQGWY